MRGSSSGYRTPHPSAGTSDVTQGTCATEGATRNLQILNGNVRKAKLLQPCREQVKPAKLLDYPAFAQLAVNAPLERAGKAVAPEKAVRNDEASAGP